MVPNTWHTDYPVKPTAESRARVMYHTVTGAEVADEGLRSLAGRSSAAAGPKLAHFRVADVSKALMSVAEMVDANYSVIFERDDLGVDQSRSVTARQVRSSTLRGATTCMRSSGSLCRSGT